MGVTCGQEMRIKVEENAGRSTYFILHSRERASFLLTAGPWSPLRSGSGICTPIVIISVFTLSLSALRRLLSSNSHKLHTRQ